MKTSCSTEPRNPPPDCLRLVREQAAQIRPTEEIRGWYSGYVEKQSRRIALDLDHITRRLDKGGRILEVGSAPFLLPAALKRQGYSIEGVDLAPERFREICDELALEVHKCDIENEPLPVPDEHYDTVIFFEIFEHLRINPIATLREVLRVLKPGGKLLLSTPNGKSIGHLLNYLFKDRMGQEIYEQYEKLEKIGHMGHVREYTPGEVCRFLERLGFQVRELVYRGGFPQRPYLRPVLSLRPSFKPYFMVVAEKPQAK